MTPEPTIDLEFKFIQAIDKATNRMLHREVIAEIAKQLVGVVVTERLVETKKEKLIGIGLTPMGGFVPIKDTRSCDGYRFSMARIDTKVVSRLDCSNLFNITHHLENCFK